MFPPIRTVRLLRQRQLSFHYDRRQIILERNKTSEELAGKYIDLYDYADGTLEIRWKGISLPYRVFAKDQHVTQTAVVENKRLGHALSLVKAQQDTKRDEGADHQRKGRLQEASAPGLWPWLHRSKPSARRGGNDVLRKAWKTDDRAVRLPPFPQTLEITS